VGVEGEEKDLGYSAIDQVPQALGGRGAPISHAKGNGEVEAPSEETLDFATDGDQRRAFPTPDLAVGGSRLAGTAGEYGAKDDEFPKQIRRIDHALIHEELMEISPNVGDIGGIGRAEIE
jgi:hypothetical protein